MGTVPITSGLERLGRWTVDRSEFGKSARDGVEFRAVNPTDPDGTFERKGPS